MINKFEDFVLINEGFKSNKLRDIIRQHGKPEYDYDKFILHDLEDDEIIGVKRILDRKIVELNQEGYLNGHTPFSSIVAFITYLVAYLNGKKNIILSNEASANQPTVIGTKINHQYSKTYEFESDFMNYMNEFISLDIKYFNPSYLLSIIKPYINNLIGRGADLKR